MAAALWAGVALVLESRARRRLLADRVHAFTAARTTAAARRHLIGRTLHRRRVLAQLPATLVHLASLLASGWSVPAAVGRVADRADAAVGEELGPLAAALAGGAPEAAALREWTSATKSLWRYDLAAILLTERRHPAPGLHALARATRDRRAR